MPTSIRGLNVPNEIEIRVDGARVGSSGWAAALSSPQPTAGSTCDAKNPLVRRMTRCRFVSR